MSNTRETGRGLQREFAAIRQRAYTLAHLTGLPMYHLIAIEAGQHLAELGHARQQSKEFPHAS